MFFKRTREARPFNLVLLLLMQDEPQTPQSTGLSARHGRRVQARKVVRPPAHHGRRLYRHKKWSVRLPATAAGVASHRKWSVRPPAMDVHGRGVASHRKLSVRPPATDAHGRGVASHRKWSVRPPATDAHGRGVATHG